MRNRGRIFGIEELCDAILGFVSLAVPGLDRSKCNILWVETMINGFQAIVK
jgi:hypothetical protein